MEPFAKSLLASLRLGHRRHLHLPPPAAGRRRCSRSPRQVHRGGCHRHEFHLCCAGKRCRGLQLPGQQLNRAVRACLALGGAALELKASLECRSRAIMRAGQAKGAPGFNSGPQRSGGGKDLCTSKPANGEAFPSCL